MPNRASVGAALRDALRDPLVYAPLLGAGVIAAGGWDHDIADWAVDKSPVFGSSKAAVDASDVMLNVLRGEAGLTLLAAPDGEALGREWRRKKLGHLALDAFAFYATEGSTRLGKETVRRQRPNGESRSSFPSGHASSTASLMTLSNRHLAELDLPPRLRTGLQVVNTGLALGTAWARVEGAKHYPTDVLVGHALGRFLARVIHDAWRLPEERLRIEAQPSRGVVGISLNWRY